MTNQEVHNKVKMEYALRMRYLDGWQQVFVQKYRHIPPGWCDTNIHDTYQCYGHYWYFKDPADAMMFALTWA